MRQSICCLLAVTAICICAAGARATEDDVPWPHAESVSNAALVYYRAFLLLKQGKTPEAVAAERKALEKLEDAREYDADILDPLLDRNAEAFRLLRKAGSIGSCDFGVDYGDGFGVQLVELGLCRRITRLELAAARRALRRGEPAEAAACFNDVLILAGHIRRQSIISLLVSQVMVGLVFWDSDYLLSQIADDAKLCEDLDGMIRSFQEDLSYWEFVFDGEMKLMTRYFPPPGTTWPRDRLARSLSELLKYDSEIKGQASALTSEQITSILQGQGSLEEQKRVADFLECHTTELTDTAKISAHLNGHGSYYMSICRKAAPLMALPYWDGLPKLKALEEEASKKSGIGDLLQPPAFVKLRVSAAGLETQLAMMRCAAAILRWRAEHGRLPEPAAPADDNEAAFLNSLPKIPYFKDRRIEYDLLPDGGFSLSADQRPGPGRQMLGPWRMAIDLRP